MHTEISADKPIYLSLRERVTGRDLADYLSHKVSARTLADQYGVTLKYLRDTLPKRPPKPATPTKKELRAIRNEYRDHLAKCLDRGEITIDDACSQAGCCARTMYRHLARVRKEAQNA